MVLYLQKIAFRGSNNGSNGEQGQFCVRIMPPKAAGGSIKSLLGYSKMILMANEGNFAFAVSLTRLKFPRVVCNPGMSRNFLPPYLSF